jgi:hypothetical protein
VLAAPTARSLSYVSAGASDSGHLGAAAPKLVTDLSRYLAPRTRGERYEAAVLGYASAAPLIIRDARSLLIMTGIKRRPLTSVAALSSAVARGQVRYAVVGGACGTIGLRRVAKCGPAATWIRTHATDVTRATGLRSRGELFRFRTASAAVPRSKWG